MVAITIILYAPLWRLSKFIEQQSRVSDAHRFGGRWLQRIIRFILLPISWIVELLALPAILIFLMASLAWGIRRLDDLIDEEVLKLLDSELPRFVSTDIVTRGVGRGREEWDSRLTGIAAKLESIGPMARLQTELKAGRHIPFFGLVGVFLIVASFAMKVLGSSS